MKKMLTILGSLGLTATTSTTIVSCQTETKGELLEQLAKKMSYTNLVIAIANTPLEVKDLKDEVIKSLTRKMVSNYGVNTKGYFKDSKIKTITINGWELLENGQLISNTKITRKKLEGKQKVIVLIEKSEFKFQINFTFDSDF